MTPPIGTLSMNRNGAPCVGAVPEQHDVAGSRQLRGAVPRRRDAEVGDGVEVRARADGRGHPDRRRVDVLGDGRTERRVDRRRRAGRRRRAEIPAVEVGDQVQPLLGEQADAAVARSHDRVVGDRLIPRVDVEVRRQRTRRRRTGTP